MKFIANNIEMVVDSFRIIQVNDNYIDQTCDVLVELKNDQSTLIEWFQGFKYENDSWTTDEIELFIHSNLDK